MSLQTMRRYCLYYRLFSRAGQRLHLPGKWAILVPKQQNRDGGAAMAKQIVCIGDSNTWGYDPRGFGGGRYPAAVRWTAQLDSLPEWVIHNLGENGREIPHSAFALRLLGQQLEALAPLDGMCVMLGSNDLLCGASPAA